MPLCGILCRRQKDRKSSASEKTGSSGKKSGQVCEEGTSLLEIPGKHGSCAEDRFQGKNGFHQRDSLSEVDHAPSSGKSRAGETEKDKAEIQPEDFHCGTTV